MTESLDPDLAEGSGRHRLERNKANVMAFYDLMFNECKPAEGHAC